MHVAGTQSTAFEVAKLVEHEQRVIAGAGVMAVPDAHLLLAVGRAPCRAPCHEVAFGSAQGRSTGQTGRQEKRSSWAPRAIASRSVPSDSAKPRSPAPRCHRQSSASPD